MRASRYAVNVGLRSPHPISTRARQAATDSLVGAVSALRMTIRSGRKETGVRSESRSGSGVEDRTQRRDLTASTDMGLLRSGMRIHLRPKVGGVLSAGSRKVARIDSISTTIIGRGIIEESYVPSAITQSRDLSLSMIGQIKPTRTWFSMKKSIGRL